MKKGASSLFNAREVEWLKINFMMVARDYHREFCALFNRRDITPRQLVRFRTNQGLKTGRNPPRLFSHEEIVWLKANFMMVERDYHREFCARFGREDITLKQLVTKRRDLGLKTGRVSFPKGYRPFNMKHVGHERVNKRSGFVEINVGKRHYVFKHRLLWEEINGPVPEGRCLKCLDSNKLNTDPSNWEAIPIGVRNRLCSPGRPNYDDAPPELKPTIMAVAKLEHRIRQKSRSEKKAAPPPRQPNLKVANAKNPDVR